MFVKRIMRKYENRKMFQNLKWQVAKVEEVYINKEQNRINILPSIFAFAIKIIWNSVFSKCVGHFRFFRLMLSYLRFPIL